jgi:malate dehydrogenase (oxaloacetate-decarboxylating)
MSIEPAVMDVTLSGFELLTNPLLNKGTAFGSRARSFRLHVVAASCGYASTSRSLALESAAQFRNGFGRYAFLRDLQDTNETLFHALLVRHIEELLPLRLHADRRRGRQRFSARSGESPRRLSSHANKARIPEILTIPISTA